MMGTEFDTFISGEAIDLVVLTADVVETSDWYRWFNDQNNMRNMQKHYFPNTKEMQLNYLKQAIEGSTTKLQLGIVTKPAYELIGVIGLNNIDLLHRKSEITGFIGETRFQTIEPFLEANKLIIRHAFNELNLNRIYGGTLSNELSSFYCRLLGFKQEGILRSDVFKNGEYRAVYSIGLLKEECSYLGRNK